MLLEATAVSLPNDVILDILSRMPARSLRRFQCVSREWGALICDPVFLAAHKSRCPEPLPLLVDIGYFRGNKQPDLRLRDLSGNIVRVIQGVGGYDILPTTSLDGLVCFINGLSKGVHVLNLATGEVLSTITGLQVTKQMHDFDICQFETFGIGRAASSNVYKVVRLVKGDTCQVLTLGADTRWRMKTHSINEYFLDRYCSPVTIDGIMYFLTEGTSGTLLCFDLENEEWKNEPIKGPSEVHGAKMWSTIAVCLTMLNGFLCVVQEEYNDVGMFRYLHDSSTNVWIKDDLDKGDWTKVYTIQMGRFGYSYMPIRVMHGGEKLLVQYVSRYMHGRPSFGLYDPHTKTCMEITRGTDYLHSKIVLCNLHL